VILFWVLAIALVLSAVFTIVQKVPVYSVVGLLANFVALAILYLTLNAEFVFVMQIVVYSGAVLVLFLFVIAMLSSGVGPFAEGPNRLPHALGPALGIVAVGVAALIYSMARVTLQAPDAPAGSAQLGQAGQAGVFGSIADFGAALFSAHLLPFEVTALILMVAVVGVVVLAGDAAPMPTRGKHAPKRAAREREPIARVRR
jgi:NADH-quinone oxidoreductase subunit J